MIVCIIITLLALIGMSVQILYIRTNMALKDQRENFELKMKVIDEDIDQMNEDEANLREQYDQIYASKTDAISLLGAETDTKISDELLRELKEAMNVENSVVINADGKILAEAEPTDVDFSSPRYNQLRAVLTDPDSYAPLTVDQDDGSVRYYASLVKEDQIGIISVRTDEIEENISNNVSLENTLKKIHVGQNGFVVAIDAQNYNFLYSPETSLIGKNAVNMGIRAERLEDGYEGYITSDDVDYYCAVMEKDKVFYICVVPQKEIFYSNLMTVILADVALGFFLIILLAYYFFLEHEYKDEEGTHIVEKGYMHKEIRKRLSIPLILGILLIFGATYYVQTLFTLSQQSITNNARAEEAISAIKNTEEETDRLTEEYNRNYLEKCQLASYIIQRVEEKKPLTRDFMIRLREALQVEQVWYFDMDGKTKATDQSFWSYQISNYEGDQSYDFWMILEGAMLNYIQDPMINDMGDYTQIIGTAMQDESLHTVGMVQIAVTPDRMETKLMNTTLSSILRGIQTGNNGFAFAINKKKGSFDYYPDSDLKGQDATQYGMDESEIRAGYNDFLTIDGVEYYASSTETKQEYVYIAVPSQTLGDITFPISCIITVYSALIMILLWLLLSYEAKGVLREPLETRENHEMIEVEDGSGRVMKSRSFLSRFDHSQVDWSDQTAGQKLFTLIKVLVIVLSLVFLYMLINVDKCFDENSIIHYIMKGSWQRRLNIFSITSCVMTVVVVNVVVILVRDFLSWIIENANAKAITVLRMLDNFLKFATTIGLIYYCLGLFGVDTKTLVASAGILTLIIGLGANSLVNDIIAGLFLVLEGEFQVGDIVTIDGFRGTVLEIGVRTVKVKEGAGNVKIFSNRNVSNVINMTKDLSVVAVDMSIEYGEDLEYVENVLEKEFPTIRENLPAICDGPYYKGVSELGNNSVDIKVICQCKEADRLQLDRDLRRELKLVFDRYRINIPYPQVVVNEPCDHFHHSVKKAKDQAKSFSKEQGELSKHMHEDD